MFTFTKPLNTYAIKSETKANVELTSVDKYIRNANNALNPNHSVIDNLKGNLSLPHPIIMLKRRIITPPIPLII